MASPHPTPDFPPPPSDPALDTSLDADPDIDMTTAPAAPSHPSADAPLDFSANSLKDEDFDMDPLHAPSPSRDDAPEPDARLPLKKDISLRDFLGRMDEYAPIIPDAVTAHALTLAGLPPPPPPSSLSNTTTTTTTTAPLPPHTPLHLSRLLALATQKFIADIAADAYQYSRMRSGTVTSNSLAAQAGGAQPGGALGTNTAAAAGPVAGGGGGGALGGGGAAGGKGGEKGTGQHVLGMQRPGFGGGGQGGGQGRTVLTMEDLGMAVGEYGVSVRRGEFYR
ncbi:hypothetical protein MMC32_000300 [Xylographa parallela]|nr:hypothetical protein [Xylographa parallela]